MRTLHVAISWAKALFEYAVDAKALFHVSVGVNGFALVRVVDGGLLETFDDDAGAVRYETRTPR